MAVLPEQHQLTIRTLGETTVRSPLAAGETTFTSEDSGVLVATRRDDLRGGEPAAFEAAGPRRRLFFDPADAGIGIVTCGGLCPGINDVIRSIVLTSWHGYGVRRLIGFRYGFAGLAGGDGPPPMALDPERVGGIHTLGGTILGTSRGPQSLADMVETLRQQRIDVLFTIGGDGTLRGAAALVEEIARRELPIAVIGIPKTIDNDIRWVERTFGFATAVNEATRSIVAAHTEAHGACHGVGLVKLMGRYSGFIAAHATLANSQVDLCLVPEVPFALDGDDGLLALVERRLRRRGHAVIVAAEGAGQELLGEPEPGFDASGNRALGDVGSFLQRRIREHLTRAGIDGSVKYIDPSYLIRSLPANAFDSELCLALGQHAVHAGLAGKTGMLVATWRGEYTHVPLELAAGGRNVLDPGGVTWQRVLGATRQPPRLGAGGKGEQP